MSQAISIRLEGAALLIFASATIGQMIAVSIVHGGPGPQCLSHAVADYLCYGMWRVRATVADVPDSTIREKLRLVCFDTNLLYSLVINKINDWSLH